MTQQECISSIFLIACDASQCEVSSETISEEVKYQREMKLQAPRHAEKPPLPE